MRLSYSAGFRRVSLDPTRHQTILSEVQRLRGRVYSADGAVSVSALHSEERHSMENDMGCCHLAIWDDQNRVAGCLRLLSHHEPTPFDRLQVRHSALARSRQWG